MLPSSIMTFMSFTQQPSTPLSVLVARDTACCMASSKPCSEMALSSVTLAMLIRLCLLKPWFAAHLIAPATFTALSPWQRPSCPWLYPCAGPSVLQPSCLYLRSVNRRPPSHGPWLYPRLLRPCPCCSLWASRPSRRRFRIVLILTPWPLGAH